MTSGVYLISFESGNEYVGSSSNIEKRKHRHLSSLRRSLHHCVPLQRAFDKYGETGLRFSILLECAPSDLLLFEQRAIDVLKPRYNVALKAGSPMSGRKHSDKTRLKMRASKNAPEFKAHMSFVMSGRVNGPAPESAKLKSRYAQADKVRCIELDKQFPSTFDAATWCVEQGLAKSINCRVNINSATRNPNATAYGYHWTKVKEIK